MPIKRWINSANNAIEGILQAAQTQRHLRYHFYTAAVALMASYALGVTKNEFLIISLAVIIVLAAEMLNSAIENVVDIVSPGKSEKARAAKDIAAGAVLIVAFGAAVVGYIVLFPYIRKVYAMGFVATRHSAEEVSIISFILVMIVVILMKAYSGTGLPLRGGMPSGHTALAFSAWVSATMTTHSVFVSVVCFTLAVVIGQSRVVARVHKIREVIVGGTVGAGLTYLLFLVFS